MESAEKTWTVLKLLTEVSKSMQHYYFNRIFSERTVFKNWFISIMIIISKQRYL